MITDVDVVIVGGGAAGIGSARRLAASGLSTLLIEAGPRLGGRAWTRNIAGLDLDIGCGWLHSADRNSWTRVAADSGVPIDRSTPAWGVQFRDLGFTAPEQKSARQALAAWSERLARTPPDSDRAGDSLGADGPWNAYIEAIVGFISGARPQEMSAADYAAYDESSTDANWRIPKGYGALIADSFPRGVALRLRTPAESIELEPQRIRVNTPAGGARARAAILTISTTALARGTLELPPQLDAWRHAASRLPLGRNEKLFLEIVGDAGLEPETQVIGEPRAARTGAYYLRPFGRPVVEAFFGAEGARLVEQDGAAEGFAFAIEQLSALFGSRVRGALRPLVASAWGVDPRIGGAYSYALPGSAGERQALGLAFDNRLFFAGEATSTSDFSTAHGAHDSGVRAAEQAIAALGKTG